MSWVSVDPLQHKPIELSPRHIHAPTGHLDGIGRKMDSEIARKTKERRKQMNKEERKKDKEDQNIISEGLPEFGGSFLNSDSKGPQVDFSIERASKKYGTKLSVDVEPSLEDILDSGRTTKQKQITD